MPFPIGPTNGQQTTINGVSYTYSTALTAWTVTSSGGSLTVATAVSATGNITGSYILGNGSALTGIAGFGGGGNANIVNGTSNVQILTTGANVTVAVGGTSNVAVFATTGEYVTGVVSASGNITGSYILGNGSQLTGISAGGGSSIANGTSNVNISTSAGNVVVAVAGVSNVATFSSTGAYLALPAGSTTVAPLRLGNATSNLSTPVTGAMEVSYGQLYFTPFSANRAYVSTPFFYYKGSQTPITNLAFTPTNWLGASVQLQASTLYRFEGQFTVTSDGTSSRQEQILFASSAGITMYYQVTRTSINLSTPSLPPANVTVGYSSASGALTIGPTVTSGQNAVYTMSGIVSLSNNGTFQPQWQTNGAPGNGNFLQGAYMRIEPIQGNYFGGTVAVGTWA